MTNLTVCLLSCGEETEIECFHAISHWRDKVNFIEIRNVYPQVKALNQMLEMTTTPYLVPLDADMVLNTDAYERIKYAIDTHCYENNWHSILFHLYDTFTEREILALKIFRTEVVKKFPFRDEPTPDIKHFKELTAANYICLNKFQYGVIGKHVLRGKHFVYHKFRDVYLTLRKVGWEWDTGVFLGGESILQKATNHFNYFLYKWLETENDDYIYAIAGMADGLTSNIEGSKSLDRPIKIGKVQAIDEFYNWLQIEVKRQLDNVYI